MRLAELLAAKVYTNPNQPNRIAQNFVKDSFNFSANLSRPECSVVNSPLGDPNKAAILDLLT